MCTAITYKTKDHYFGRNLDLDDTYYEMVTVTPRNYPFRYRKMGAVLQHYAMIGIACIVDDYPLYYDAVNEKGLGMAGLHFPQNAVYKPEVPDRDNVPPFELIPWLLGQCATVGEVREKLERIHLVNLDFKETLPLSPLHWMVADRESSITVEAVQDGVKVYDNPAGVMTNNPAFDIQLFNLNNFMYLSTEPPRNQFCSSLPLDAYSLGMGAMGLPGDMSSMSRFVKAVFTKLNSVSDSSESASISQFFHILHSVEMQRGCVRVGENRYEITEYSCCCNVDRGIYYYTTYENSQITGVDMYKEDLDGSRLVTYPLLKGQRVRMQNG